MIAPLVQIIETGVGRAQRLSPEIIREATPDVVAAWLLTMGQPNLQWQAVLTITAQPPGGVLRMYTHNLTIAGLASHRLVRPRKALYASIRPDELFMQMVRLREGSPQAVRLARDLVRQIMRGELDPIPVSRADRAAWRIAIGLGLAASLSPSGREYVEIAYVKRQEDR